MQVISAYQLSYLGLGGRNVGNFCIHTTYSRSSRTVPKIFDQFICSSLEVPLINFSKF